MSGYLPSLSDRKDPDPADPMVLDLHSEDAGDVIGALSSETARSIMRALHDDPLTLSELADVVDTSRQNAQYHIKRLQGVDAVRVVDTIYSEKGREMKVYAPAGEPLIFVSDDDQGSRLYDAVRDLFAPVLSIGLVAIAFQLVVDRFDRPAGDHLLAEPTGVPTRSEETVDSIEVYSGYVDGEEVVLDEPIVVDLVGGSQPLWETYPGLVLFGGAAIALLLATAWWNRDALAR